MSCNPEHTNARIDAVSKRVDEVADLLEKSHGVQSKKLRAVTERLAKLEAQAAPSYAEHEDAPTFDTRQRPCQCAGAHRRVTCASCGGFRLVRVEDQGKPTAPDCANKPAGEPMVPLRLVEELILVGAAKSLTNEKDKARREWVKAIAEVRAAATTPKAESWSDQQLRDPKIAEAHMDRCIELEGEIERLKARPVFDEAAIERLAAFLGPEVFGVIHMLYPGDGFHNWKPTAQKIAALLGETKT